MRRKTWLAAGLIIAALSSCNLPLARTRETPEPVLTAPLDLPESSTPTVTPIPIETLISLEFPTLIPTQTPSVFLAAPRDQPVNCRFGPGTSYTVIGALVLGRQAEMIGRNPDSTWWYVRNPSDPSTSCWLSAEFVATVGDVQALPVVNSPDIMVTGLSVSIEPPVLNVACDALPQTVLIIARITTSGPATVTWHWSSSAGVVSPDKQIIYAVGDTKTVQDYYQVNRVSDYMIQVQTTWPNIMTGQASFKVVCTP